MNISELFELIKNNLVIKKKGNAVVIGTKINWSKKLRYGSKNRVSARPFK